MERVPIDKNKMKLETNSGGGGAEVVKVRILKLDAFTFRCQTTIG